MSLLRALDFNGVLIAKVWSYFKLDIKKVYLHVNCDFVNFFFWISGFVICVMKRMGFREKWIYRIRQSIPSDSFAILINGSPTEFFSAFKGLRQGDHLSPLLVFVVMEVFTRMIASTSSNDLIFGFLWSSERLSYKCLTSF